MRPSFPTIVVSIVFFVLLAAGQPEAKPNTGRGFDYQLSLIRSGQYLEAMGSLRDSIIYYNTRSDANSLEMVSEAYRLRGDICAYYLGRIDDAMQEYGKSIVAHPHGYAAAVSHFQRGLVYYNRGRLKRAYREFAPMVRSFSGDEKAKVARDYMRAIKKQYRKSRIARAKSRPPVAPAVAVQGRRIVPEPPISTDREEVIAAPLLSALASVPSAETSDTAQSDTEQVVAAVDTSSVGENVRPPQRLPIVTKPSPMPVPDGSMRGIVNVPHAKRVESIILQREFEREFYRSPILRSGVLIGTVPLVAEQVSARAMVVRGDSTRIPEEIRVCLSYRSVGLKVGGTRRFDIFDRRGNLAAANVAEADFKYSGGKVSYAGQGYDAMVLRPVEGSWVSFAGKRYRGRFEVIADGAGLDLINVLDLDSYLYGVLPREVIASWPEESLKAQAVAARTYAMFQMNKSVGLPFDLDATVMSQVYGGLDDEHPPTNLAVEQTVGQIMTYNNELIVAYFHSDSGGITEGAGNVWGLDFPYLVSFEDSYSGPKDWHVDYSFDEVRRLLKKSGVEMGKINSISIAETGQSGRAIVMNIAHSGGVEKIGSNKFRIALGAGKLRSTLFELRINRRTAYFSGRGFGHGVGMSQNGAKAMADAGYHYYDILKHYYRGVEISRMTDAVAGRGR
jgi:stage II sporulation protein D (peptidoglycan lytic transglycosylase)